MTTSHFDRKLFGNKKPRRTAVFFGLANQAFLIFSSILKIPLLDPWNKRLYSLPKQRRSRVLRRVRLRSPAIMSSLKWIELGFAAKPEILADRAYGVTVKRHTENDDPQPQVEDAFGFLITNCAPSNPSV